MGKRIESSSLVHILVCLILVAGCSQSDVVSKAKLVTHPTSTSDDPEPVVPTSKPPAKIQSTSASSKNATPVSLADFRRKLIREPEYESDPQYCVLAFGANGEQTMWLVLDGFSIYADLNGNGDLSDDGEPLTPFNERTLSVDYQDGDYEPINLASGKELLLGYFRSDQGPFKQTVKLISDGIVEQYAGWQPIFSPTAEEAKIFHFGGKFEPLALRKKQVQLSGTEQELNVAFAVNNPRGNARTLLSIEFVPQDVTPVLEIEWPTNGSSPLRSQVKLTERC